MAKTVAMGKFRPVMDMNKAKATLGFSPSAAIDDLSEAKLQSKFTQKLQDAGPDETRLDSSIYNNYIWRLNMHIFTITYIIK